MANKKKKRKLTKRKKKFFIILACYVATFIITSLVTLSTLAWFNDSDWQDEVLYMGGPVYIYFSDDTETNITSGSGKLKTELPAGWDRLYPGMNINFEATAVIQGHTFNNTTTNGDIFTQYTTTAVLRARIRLDVYDPRTGGTSDLTKEIYDWLWPQLKKIAITDETETGAWVFDEIDTETAENNYFYYVVKDQTDKDESGKYLLNEVGGLNHNVAVEFLNNAVIQLPGIELTNDHADCELTFTVIFEALQAYFPYTRDEVGTALFQGDTTDRSIYVTTDDVGIGKPLTIENSRRIFSEAQDPYKNL